MYTSRCTGVLGTLGQGYALCGRTSPLQCSKKFAVASNAQVTAKIVHLSYTPAPIQEYATHVTDKGRP
jgi:hypothetical protein